MSIFQIVMCVLAAGLVVSTFWENLVSMFNSMKQPKKPNTPDWMDDIANDVVAQKTELMMIVAAWDNLRMRCEDAGLDQAVEELTMIWPLLVDGGSDNVEIR